MRIKQSFYFTQVLFWLWFVYILSKDGDGFREAIVENFTNIKEDFECLQKK